MTTNFKNQKTASGLTLKEETIDLINKINAFPHADLEGYGSIGAINAQVPVILADKDPHPTVKTLNLTKEEVIAKREDMRAKYIQFHDKYNATKNPTDKALWIYYESLYGQYSNLVYECDDDQAAIYIPETWFGCYNPNTNEVTLYLETLGGNTNDIAVTYVHEMMHAYFATQNAIREIEEPITEYATLRFLKAFDQDLFEHAHRAISLKKTTLTVPFYGFGAYLYDATTTDWLRLNKSRGSNIPSSKNLKVYQGLFEDGYPIDNEKDCAELLVRILNGIKTGVRLNKKTRAASALEEAVLNDVVVTPFAYDKKTSTIYINGDVNCPLSDNYVEDFFDLYDCYKGVKPSSIRVVLGPSARGHLRLHSRHSASPTIKEVVLSPKNTYYKIENDLLLSKDGKKIYSPIRTTGSIIIPEGVESIEHHAFEGCKNLTSVRFPNSLKEIGIIAFGHTGLTSIKLPGGLKEIGGLAFFMTPLKSVFIPKSVESIDDSSFDRGVTITIDPANVKLNASKAKALAS